MIDRDIVKSRAINLLWIRACPFDAELYDAGCEQLVDWELDMIEQIAAQCGCDVDSGRFEGIMKAWHENGGDADDLLVCLEAEF